MTNIHAILSAGMNTDFSKNILIFTDGACSGNPGPGGFGSIIAYPEGHIEELGEGRAETTNNRMELVAILKALQALGDKPGEVWVITDSVYAIRGITQWIWGWKKNGWKTAENNDVNNKDIWLALDEVVSQRKKVDKIEWKYVRGHTGVPGNERCDEIAVAFTKQKSIRLYTGDLLNYPYAIYDLPDDMSVPEMKPKGEKKKAAYSYLSYVNGQLRRHSNWPECEAQVKGRPGAKFKKSTSAENEIEIVESWGLNPKKLDEV